MYDSKGKLAILQIFRGCAAMAVFFYHVDLQFPEAFFATEVPDEISLFGGLFAKGFLGVDFFFVVSGFIIFYIHEGDVGKGGRARAYVLKRVIRIHPMLLLITGAKVLYLFLFIPGFDEAKSPSNIVGAMLALPGYSLVSVAWTLSFEYLFYFFFLFCILMGRRFMIGVPVLWIGAILLLQPFLLDDPWSLAWFLFNPHVIEFFAGMGAAWVFRRKGGNGTHWWISLGALALLSVAGFFYYPAGASARELAGTIHFLGAKVYWGLFFALLVLVALRFDDFFGKRIFWIFVFLGNASYSIYLFHGEQITFWIRMIERFSLHTRFDLALLGYGVALVSLPVTLVIYRCIEKPVTRFLRARLLPGRGD